MFGKKNYFSMVIISSFEVDNVKKHNSFTEMAEIYQELKYIKELHRPIGDNCINKTMQIPHFKCFQNCLKLF